MRIPRIVMKNIAVILAGGRGSRMGTDLPKQFIRLQDGRTVLETCVDVFHQNEHIDEIAIVMLREYFTEAQALLPADRFPKIRYWIPGGAERWESSLNAIKTIADANDSMTKSSINCKSSIVQSSIIDCVNVLIHDCARPFVSQDLLNRVCEALEQHEAVTVAVPVTDTLYEVRTVADDELVQTIPPRSLFRRAQTPQAFRLSVMQKAFHIAMHDEARTFTDDVGVALRYLPDTPIHIIPGEESNKKLTFKEDINL